MGAVALDFSKAVPITGNGPAPADDPASALQSAVSYGVQQDPVQHAKLLQLQQKLGIPPVVSQGNEPQVQQAADVQSIDYPQFAAANPRTTAWASDPDNAAVSGVDELHRVAGIEKNAAAMREGQHFVSANTPSFWDKAAFNMRIATKFLTGKSTDDLEQGVYQYPLTRWGIGSVGGASGLVGNVGSFLGWDGDGPTKQNLLQRIQTNLSPEANTDPLSTFHTTTPFDSLVQNVAPMIPAVIASGGVSLLATKLGVSTTAAKVLAGLSVGALFDADQAGKTRTAVLSSGGSDYEARLAANRVAAINAIPNALFGATDVVPLLRDNPLLTSLGLGGLTGATGQIGQNVVTGQPWSQGVPSAMAQGAAMQGGLHIGIGLVGQMGQAVDAAEQSKLRERSPEKFNEAMQTVFAGDQSLRIPAEQFSSYFSGKGMDPAEVAKGLSSTNYAEAVLSGGDVEIPPADFLSKLDPEHQRALLPDIVDPATGLSANQHQQGREELEQWATGGGAAKLVADTAAADAETAATTEYQDVHEQLRQRYVDAGESPEVAETLATKDANVYSNLARSAGMKPSELLGLYNPKVVSGEAPAGAEAQALHQNAIESIRSVVEAAKEPGDVKRWSIYAPVSKWLSDTARTVGHELEGYNHGIDADAIRHTIGEHGNAEIEGKRGQLPITDADFDQIPRIVSEPDRVIFGAKTADGLDSIGYVKKLEDGSIAYVEEKRTGRKRLSARTMWKYPAAKDVDDIAASLPPNARNDGERTNPIVVRGPKADNETLAQTSEDGARGWFRVLPDGSYEIGKTRIGDLSTFVHEPAHAYLKIIGDLSKREGASDVLKDDYAKVLDFLGAKDGEDLTREQQETWARANEQYLREGKAPSPGLKGAFQRFAIWLGSVYKHVSDLGVNLSDDIRGVFDRLYAAEDGVNKAETEAGPKLFSTAEEAGWNDVQFKVYADMNKISVDEAKSQILGMMNDAAVREKTDAWRNEEQNVRTAVTADIDSSPEYSAIRALRRGSLDDGTGIALSKDELVKQFGEDRVREMQKQHPGLYRNEGGLDAESTAEILGFNSAEQMMKMLENSPRRSAVIEQATREYMTAKHGDIRYDGTLNDQARIALENDKRADSLYSELKALKKMLADVKGQVAGQKADMRAIDVAPIEAYREAAQQMVEAKTVADIQPTRYLDASRKYSREAFDAVRKGDTLAAEAAKHKELMNHFLFREATKAKEYVGKFEAYAKRVQKTAVQEKLGLAGDDYRDQFNRILGRYMLGPNVKAERSLAEWSAALYEQGKEPAIDPVILNEARMINYRNAPVSEIRAVHDALINVRKLASLELAMEVNGRKIEFNAAMANMDATAHESLPTRPTRVLEDNATAGEIGRNFLQRGDAMMARTEFLMKQLDGGVTGPWHDNLWNLAADAQGNEYKLQEEVTKRIGDALENMPKEQRLRMLDKVTVDGIPETVTRKDLVSIAFNLGNDGNLERLEKTFVQHGWEPRAIENIKGMLTREEWQFVQDGWDSLKPLGQAQSELERRMTGLPPVMVKPTPLRVDLADGTSMDLEGGYYPVVMDPRFSKRGATADAGTTAQNLMETGYGRASTSRGNMQARTGYGGAMQLDYEQVLTQHTAKVIKDITHREFMLVANKLLMDPQIRQTIRETLGPGYEEKMMPWLRTMINDRNGSAVQGVGDLSRWMGKLRTNVVKASLGFKASTMLLQLTHASSIFLHTSPGSYAQAMVDFLAHPSEMTEEIRDLSPNEMHNRGENIDRDMREVLQNGIGKQSVSKVIARAGMFPVKMMDHVLSFPLWKAVYQDALKEHVDLPEDRAQSLAMYKADGAVRMALGSNAPKDLPPVMRNNDFLKIITTLGGFHNLKWNQMTDVGRDFSRNRNVGQFTYRMMMAAVVPAVVGAYVTGRGPKDDENRGLWAAKRALLFAPETIPIAGDVTQAMLEGGDAKFTPLMNVAEKAVRAGHGAFGDKEDKDWTGIGLDSGEAAGELFGVPGTEQAVKTLRYAHAAQEGKVNDPNAWDAVVGAPRR